MSLAKQAAANAGWSVVLFWARFGINSVVFLLLARWLSTDEIGAYGVAFGLVQVFLAVLTSGFPEAVIRDDGRSKGYADTAQSIAMLAGLAMSIFLLIIAQPLGQLYNSPHMGQYMLLLAIVPTATAFGTVSEGLIRSGLELRRLAIRTMFALTLAGIVAIWLATSGYGGLALVAFTIVNNVVAALLNYLLAPTRPKFGLDPALVPRVVSDATGMGLRGVVKSLINPALLLIAGFFLGTTASGELYIAVRFVTLLSSLTMMPANFVSLPFFSKVQHQPEKRARALREAVGTMSLVTAPLYLGAAALAPILLPLILGTNGLPAVLLVQIMLLQSAPAVLNNLGLNALTSVGKKDLALHYAVAQLAVSIVFVCVAAQFSVQAVVLTHTLQYYLLMPWLIFMLARHLGGTGPALGLAAMRPWLAAATMSGLTMLVDHLWLSTTLATLPIVHLLALVAVGAILYVPLALLVANQEARLLIGRVRQLRS